MMYLCLIWWVDKRMRGPLCQNLHVLCAKHEEQQAEGCEDRMEAQSVSGYLDIPD